MCGKKNTTSPFSVHILNLMQEKPKWPCPLHVCDHIVFTRPWGWEEEYK